MWTPRGPVSLDLLRGYPDEVAAKIVTVAGTVTGQQFNQIAQGRLTELVTELDDAGAARTFPALQALLQRETSGRTRPQQALVDLEARLRTVTASTAEPWLRPGAGRAAPGAGGAGGPGGAARRSPSPGCGWWARSSAPGRWRRPTASPPA